jgi:hypothetical protein
LNLVNGVKEGAYGEEAVKDLMMGLYSNGHEDPPEYLSALEMEHIRSTSIVPLSSTIGEITGGIIAVNHVDNVGLDHSHSETIVG